LARREPELRKKPSWARERPMAIWSKVKVKTLKMRVRRARKMTREKAVTTRNPMLTKEMRNKKAHKITPQASSKPEELEQEESDGLRQSSELRQPTKQHKQMHKLRPKEPKLQPINRMIMQIRRPRKRRKILSKVLCRCNKRRRTCTQIHRARALSGPAQSENSFTSRSYCCQI